jgi:hypothetical protein
LDRSGFEVSFESGSVARDVGSRTNDGSGDPSRRLLKSDRFVQSLYRLPFRAMFEDLSHYKVQRVLNRF